MPITRTIIDDNINVRTKLNLQLDESQGDIVANSGDQSQQGSNNFQDGIITNSVERVTDASGNISGNALNFDSANDRLTINSHQAINDTLTLNPGVNQSFALNMQFNPDAGSMDIGAEYTIMSTRENEGSGISLEKISGNESLTLTVKDNASNGGNVRTFDIDPNQLQIEEGVWQTVNINLSRNEGGLGNLDVNIQVVNDNGLQEQDFSSTINPYTTIGANSDLVIGSSSNINNNAFSIDNIKLYDATISDIEVENIHRVETNQDGLVPNADPVASWNFDANSMGAGYTSTLGQFDHAAEFDGSQSFDTNQNLNLGNQNMTISAWINTQDQDGVILEQIQTNNGSEQGVRLLIDSGQITLELAGIDQNGDPNKVEFKLTSQESAQILSGSFENIAVSVSHDANNPDIIDQVVFYHNAEAINSSPEVVDLINPTNSQSTMINPVSMGNIDNSADLVMGSNLVGSVDEVQIFDTNLSQVGINQLYEPSSIIIGSNLNDIAQGVFRGTDRDNIMVAGLGNDIVDGVSGRNTLIGVDPNALNPGSNEIDTLIGADQGISQNKFVLGQSDQAFYVGNGSQDKAIIQNLDINQGDKIMLSGNSSQYEIQRIIENNQVVGSSISLKDSVNPNNPSDLIAEVQGVDLTSSILQNQVLDFNV